MRNIQFYAYANEQPGTEPVYQFWNSRMDKETFHFLPAHDAENKNSILFYAYREQQPGTEAVYDWSSSNSVHAIHFPPSWGEEDKGTIQFYAFPTVEAAILARENATGISPAVPITAFLLGIVAATLWVAFLKWYRGNASNDGGGDEEAPNHVAAANDGGVTATNLPSLLEGLGLAATSSKSATTADQEALLRSHDDESGKAQLLIETQEVTVISSDEKHAAEK